MSTVIVLLFFNSLVTILLLRNPIIAHDSDLRQILSGALLVRNGEGKLLYNLDTLKQYHDKVLDGNVYSIEFLPYRTLPFVALLFIPLTYLTILSAFTVSVTLNYIALVIFIILVFLAFKNIPPILKILLPFGFYPFAITVFKGKVDIFLTLVLIVIYISVVKKRMHLAGVLYSFFLIKPHFFLAGLPFFLLTVKNKQFTESVFFCGIIATLVNLLITSPDTLINYPMHVLMSENAGSGTYLHLVFSLSATFIKALKFFNIDQVFAHLLHLMFYLINIFIFWKIRKKASFKALFVLSIFFMTLFAVHVLIYDFSFLFLPMLIFLDIAFKLKSSFWLILAGSVFVMPNVQILEIYTFNPLILYLVAVVFAWKSDYFNKRDEYKGVL